MCKQKHDLPREALLQAGFARDELDELKIYKPIGCAECNEGYRGRTGIYQAMPISDDIARIILEDGNAMSIAEQAGKEGILDLRQAALHKVSAGITDLIEINRVTKD
jgi:type IV pilus assembly protein PilB